MADPDVGCIPSTIRGPCDVTQWRHTFPFRRSLNSTHCEQYFSKQNWLKCINFEENNPNFSREMLRQSAWLWLRRVIKTCCVLARHVLRSPIRELSGSGPDMQYKIIMTTGYQLVQHIFRCQWPHFVVNCNMHYVNVHNAMHGLNMEFYTRRQNCQIT